MADWVVLITHVPEELLSARAVWVLARVRWQVEIVFRVWKSCFRVDECRSRHVWRVLCALYAKLMGVVVWHWLVLVWRGGVWERSLYKAARAFQWIAIVLGGLMLVLQGACGVMFALALRAPS